MRIGVPRETRAGERRVAAVPPSVKTFTSWGLDVVVERDAGALAGHPDQAYVDAGATIGDAADANRADVILRVGPLEVAEIDGLATGATLVSFLDPFVATEVIEACATRGITAVAAEAVPRTTLAQAMDALSSQATVAGYSAVLLAASESPKLIPMMVTAAGTIRPSRALVLGVGVAGLQAIATARRLGAVVHAYDIRPETREQVESLGAKFVDAPTQQGDAGGYATEVDEETARAQQAILADHVADANVIITTAQVPGRQAPVLVTAEMVARMRPGTVVVDMAASSGGNVVGSRPDEVIDTNGVRIFGPTDLASRAATDASAMYARNLQELVGRMRTDDGLAVSLDDEVVGPSVITHAGEVVHPRARETMGLPPLGATGAHTSAPTDPNTTGTNTTDTPAGPNTTDPNTTESHRKDQP